MLWAALALKHSSSVSTGVMLSAKRSIGKDYEGWKAGGNGGGGRCNTMPPKPLEGDFLFAPLFVRLPALQGDKMFGASFSLEQKEAPPRPRVSAIPGAALSNVSPQALNSYPVPPPPCPCRAQGTVPLILRGDSSMCVLTCLPAREGRFQY